MADHSRNFRVRLPPRPASVGRARRMVRRCLSYAGREDLTETAELLVSEVVTNALVHAGTPIDVALSMGDDGVRVEVGDGSSHLPSRRRYGLAAGTGRGLMMLETMVEDWGVVPDGGGKTVWFQLDGDPGSGETVGTDSPVLTRPEAALRVRLLNVPLLLHAAWQQHAESLLREHLLARMDVEAAQDPIQVHAEASDAMAILAEHIPRPDIGDAPNQLMASAVEPHVSVDRVDVPVPASSVPHFETLDRSLESAMAMAEDGVLLTPPTQPEIRSLRRWLCEEVAGQAAGAEPTPWSADLHTSSATGELFGWDPTDVRTSAEAVIAADDASRIVAASEPVLELLGYEHRDELEGQRLVAVIPERFRQAHLAGVTMHVLTGRGPMLGASIVVPALQADGRERLVELVLETRPVPGGRTVYLGRLRAAD